MRTSGTENGSVDKWVDEAYTFYLDLHKGKESVLILLKKKLYFYWKCLVFPPLLPRYVYDCMHVAPVYPVILLLPHHHQCFDSRVKWTCRLCTHLTHIPRLRGSFDWQWGGRQLFAAKSTGGCLRGPCCVLSVRLWLQCIPIPAAATLEPHHVRKSHCINIITSR